MSVLRILIYGFKYFKIYLSNENFLDRRDSKGEIFLFQADKNLNQIIDIEVNRIQQTSIYIKLSNYIDERYLTAYYSRLLKEMLIDKKFNIFYAIFLNQISNGKLNFEKLVCTPGMMSKIGKLGKILGPKGLMPNPKLGTVSNDIVKTVKDIKTGLVEVRNDKDGNLASSIGRKSFSSEKLLENYNFFIDALKKEKPSTMKGEFILKSFLTSTMGISYKVGAK